MTVIGLHVLAGALALAAGYLALFARKGARLHRRSGTAFFVAMLVMSGTGAAVAALHDQALSVIAGSLAFYLVTTAWLTVRQPVGARWLEIGAMLAAVGIGVGGLHVGLAGLQPDAPAMEAQPPEAAFVFGGIALMAAALDLRRLLGREMQGAHRIARHLWRMCFALLIAAASFFLGQAPLIPEPLRHLPLLLGPVLLVLVLMLFWLGRVLLTKKYSRV